LFILAIILVFILRGSVNYIVSPASRGNTNSGIIFQTVTVCLYACTQPHKLMQSILSCAQLEDAVEEERLLLSSAEVDVEDVETFKSQLKGFHCIIYSC